MACVLDLEEGVRSGDQLQGGFHFRDCSERIARTVDEKSGFAQLREMGSAKLGRLSRTSGTRRFSGTRPGGEVSFPQPLGSEIAWDTLRSSGRTPRMPPG